MLIDSVVAGATAGIAAQALDLGTPACLAIGGGVFRVPLGSLALWATRQIDASTARLDPLYATPSADAG